MAKLPHQFKSPEMKGLAEAIVALGEEQREKKYIEERKAELAYAKSKGAKAGDLLADQESIARYEFELAIMHNSTCDTFEKAGITTAVGKTGYAELVMLQACHSASLALLNAHKAVTPAEKRDAAMEMKVAQKYLDEAFTA